MLISRDGRAYREIVCAIVSNLHAKPFDGDIALCAVFYPPDRRRRDLDNVGGKVLIDALGYANLFHDDCQIKRINLEMREPMENGLCAVTIGNLFDVKN